MVLIMTDKEIIQALEICTEGIYICDKDCPYYDVKSDTRTSYCKFELLGDALEFIQRQQAEIERLKKYNTDVAFKHYYDGIKEFAERLIAKAYPFPCAIGVEYAVPIRAINDTTEEMVGADNGYI